MVDWRLQHLDTKQGAGVRLAFQENKQMYAKTVILLKAQCMFGTSQVV